MAEVDTLTAQEFSSLKVLVVDDDPALQALFKQFLKKANLARLVVGSGAWVIRTWAPPFAETNPPAQAPTATPSHPPSA